MGEAVGGQRPLDCWRWGGYEEGIGEENDIKGVKVETPKGDRERQRDREAALREKSRSTRTQPKGQKEVDTAAMAKEVSVGRWVIE